MSNNIILTAGVVLVILVVSIYIILKQNPETLSAVLRIIKYMSPQTTQPEIEGTAAFKDSLKDNILTNQASKDDIDERNKTIALADAALKEANKRKMIKEMSEQISFALVDAFKVKLAKGALKSLRVFNKLILKIGTNIAAMGAHQLTKLGLKTALQDVMKKMSKKVGIDAMKTAVRTLGAKAGTAAAKAAKAGAAASKLTNPVSAFFEGISMVLDLADATGNNLTDLNYSTMMTNEMFYDLKIESNIEFEKALIEQGMKNNVVLSPLDKLTSTEISNYMTTILITNILNMPNPSGKTNVDTWVGEKLEKLLENNEITQAMIDNSSYKTDEKINSSIETKINDELEIFIDLEENKQFIAISVANLNNRLCKEKGGILVDMDKTTYADYKGYNGYPDFSKEVGMCSYTENQCVDGIAYKKSKLVYDQATNPEPDIYGEWNGEKCKMADSTALLNCDTLKLKYDPRKTLCKNSECVSGLCSIDAPYCSKFGMQYITNNNISNEKRETQKDCLTDATQDITEFLFGTVITRGLKNALGIGVKQEGESCVNGAQCNGNVPGKIGTLSCCKDTKTGLKTCTPQISDWAGIGYCPSECVGKPFGAPGTCPTYEKCHVLEDDKGDGTTCTINCDRKYPNKNAFATIITDKCVTCNNEGKDPKTGEYVYSRTAASESASDACKMGGLFGDCKYFVKKDEKGNDLMTFQHGLYGSCYSCPNDATGKPYNRTLSSIDADNACKASSCDALYPGKNSSEYLISDACYKCPDNMSRTAIGALNIHATDGCKYNGGCNAKYPGTFEHSFSGNCYSCNGGSRNANGANSGKECSMECDAGWSKDLIAGLCYKCPDGYGRNANAVWDDKSCTKEWAWGTTAKAQTKSFVQPWTLKGSVLSKPEFVGSMLSPATFQGSLLKPLTVLQNGPLKRKKNVVMSSTPISNATNCQGYDCSIEGQKCLPPAPGAGNQNWICKSGKWDVGEGFSNENEEFIGIF